MANGDFTGDLPLAQVLDEVLGNYEGDTARMSLEDLVALVVDQSAITITGATPYPNTATGLAATAANGYFSVQPGSSDPNTAFIIYQKVSGSAVERARVASAALVNAISSRVAALEASFAGLGALAAKDTIATGDIAPGAVTNGKQADMAPGTFKARVAGTIGSPQDVTADQLRSALNVEDGADVTDRANVAAAISGSPEKMTPADSNVVPIVDGNGLKWLAWTNLRTALQTAFAAVFQAKSEVLTGTTASFTTALETKIDGVEAEADVTDKFSVAAAAVSAETSTDLADPDLLVFIDVSNPSDSLRTVPAGAHKSIIRDYLMNVFQPKADALSQTESPFTNAKNAALSAATVAIDQIAAALSRKSDIGHTHHYQDLIGRPTLGSAASTSATAYATAAQGKSADAALSATKTLTPAVAELKAAVADKVDLWRGAAERPGDDPVAYATAPVADPATAAPIPATWIVKTADGPVLALPAGAMVATRGWWRVYADTVREVVVRLRRVDAVRDPASDAVEICVQQFSANLKPLHAPILLAEIVDLMPEAGLLTRRFTLSRKSSLSVDFPLSAAASFAVPFVRAYGGTGVNVEVLSHHDITRASALEERIYALEHGL